VLGIKVTGCDRGIAVVMILCLIFKMLFLKESLVAISTGDGVADELNLS
jgi:hypothetical protein